MPLTSDQLDNWFTYHAPTGETGPKYIAITAMERTCAELLTMPELTHDRVNATLRKFVELIDESAPDSADKTAAIRCVRIARNAINEAIVQATRSEHPATHCLWVCEYDAVSLPCRIAIHELIKARWQANSAIACGGR